MELATLVFANGERENAERTTQTIEVSDADVDSMFDAAGRVLSNGLHAAYWKTHSNRDAREVKVELVVVARNVSALENIQKQASSKFAELWESHRTKIAKLPEHRRQQYERLRLAASDPQPIDWVLPNTIDFRREPDAPTYDRHVFLEEDGSFRANLETWEREVVELELADDNVLGWLRNVERKPWALEIPYRSGGSIKPSFPDILVIRQNGLGIECDILEPHNPSFGDNFEKAIGLAEFAEKHGHLFGRIEMLRKIATGYRRLNFNKDAVQKEVKAITNNSQLDTIFDTLGYTTATQS